MVAACRMQGGIVLLVVPERETPSDIAGIAQHPGAYRRSSEWKGYSWECSGGMLPLSLPVSTDRRHARSLAPANPGSLCNRNDRHR